MARCADWRAMRIAITSLYLPSGSKIGVGYVVHALANQLVGRGHEVTVFSGCGPSEGALYQTEWIAPRARMATFGFALDLRRVDFSGFDVLNAHGDDWFLWGRKRPRHIHTFHGSCFAEMLHSANPKRALRMGMLAACELSPVFLADVRTAVSGATRRFVPRVEHIIPNGVDTRAFAPEPFREAPEHPTILFVGSLYGRKRGDLLVKIFREQVLPRVPNARLCGVCDPPDDARLDSEEWTGRLSQEELIERFKGADVFCLPSSYEGFGVPYIEAMAAGLPVVASPNDGAREVLRDGQDGILSSDEELGENLVRLLSHAEERKTWRERGLARARDFDWERVTDQYLALYEGK